MNGIISLSPGGIGPADDVRNDQTQGPAASVE